MDPEPSSPLVIDHPRGAVRIEEVSPGRRRVTVTPADPSVVVSSTSCETDYPVDLVAAILEVKGPLWLCDEILRESHPDYVEHDLRYAIFPFVEPSAFEGARVLDFGCGSGASTMVLGRLLPDAEIVGVELEEDLLSIARLRARHRGLEGIRLEVSPSPDELPAGVGTFDFIFFSAVYEHLLPDERRRLPALLWSVLKPGGIVFLNETPHRWFPVETHTTGLPLLNFLPDRLAHRAALRLSRRVSGRADWPTLLRQGIRGATPDEILGDFAAAGGRPRLLQPHRMGIGDAVDLWYAHGVPTAKRRAMRAVLAAVSSVVGHGYVPYLTLAIQKDG
jgi:2-polyprenyl-3-methyl-5-hydroxy-6-metoxy-1,4-benzoquinol methylase